MLKAKLLLSNFVWMRKFGHELSQKYGKQSHSPIPYVQHTHTHTYIYIYIYIYVE